MSKKSGAENRKVKKRREEESSKHAAQLMNWFSKIDTESDQPTILTTKSLDQSTDDEKEVNNDNILAQLPQRCNIIRTDEQNLTDMIQDDQQNKKTEFLINFQDPAKWPAITDNIITQLIMHGPDNNMNCDFSLSSDSDGRRFSKEWFTKYLSNGEKVERKWMLYSTSNQKIYCFPCIIFSKGMNCKFSDTSKGFNDWKHLNPRIQEHENSRQHRFSYINWKDFEIRLNKKQTLDYDFQKTIEFERDKWRNLLTVVVDAIFFCAKNNLALRGSSHIIGTADCGIFLNTVELISHYHPQVAKHIADIKAKKTSITYLSPTIQNEVIELIRQQVKNEIISRIKNAKYYSILFDCTPDVSRKEQLSQVIRYVRIHEGLCSIEESFVDFIDCHEKTGKGLAAEIIEKINENKLDISDCRGQGYDNGANMAGKYNGVQAIISRMNPNAVFIPCAAHSLNLVGLHAAEVKTNMLSFFGVVQKIFTYFSGSVVRWSMLMEVLKTTLKGHCETRWSSKKEAVNSLFNEFENVYHVLIDISKNKMMNADTLSGAQSLIKVIDFQFVCLLQMWNQILLLIDRVNRSLQSKALSIGDGVKLLSGLVESIQSLRNQGVSNIIENAKKIASRINIDDEFPDKRKRKVPRMVSEKAVDEGHLLTPEENFSKNCCSVYDSIISQIKYRFEKLNEVSSNFDFLSGSSLKILTCEQLQLCALNLANIYENDFDKNEFSSEIVSLKYQANSLLSDLATASQLDLLQVIHTYHLRDAYPNCEIALRIFLTIPVTEASCERSFSKLKIIKNYLRSSIGQERLSGLSLISIEYSICEKLNYESIINEFASCKARKAQF